MNGKSIIAVFVGGFCGGIARYLLSQTFSAGGILIANLLGCFLLAFLTYYVIEREMLASWLNAGIGTGFIGAFTTFSTLMTTIIELSTSSILSAICYLLVSALGGGLMAGAGFLLARRLGKKAQQDA